MNEVTATVCKYQTELLCFFDDHLFGVGLIVVLIAYALANVRLFSWRKK